MYTYTVVGKLTNPNLNIALPDSFCEDIQNVVSHLNSVMTVSTANKKRFRDLKILDFRSFQLTIDSELLMSRPGKSLIPLSKALYEYQGYREISFHGKLFHYISVDSENPNVPVLDDSVLLEGLIHYCMNKRHPLYFHEEKEKALTEIKRIALDSGIITKGNSNF